MDGLRQVPETPPASAVSAAPESGHIAVPAAQIRARVSTPLQISTGVFSDTELVTFHGLADQREHLAVVFAGALGQPSPLVRVHSECLTGDVLGSARCDCGPQLSEAISVLHARGGVLLYLRQEGRGIGLYNKLDAYSLQDAGLDTFEANRALNFADDQRSYTVAAQMLLALGLTEVDVLTNNPEKISQLRMAGIVVHRQRLTGVHLTEANRNYLRAKISHAGHAISVD